MNTLAIFENSQSTHGDIDPFQKEYGLQKEIYFTKSTQELVRDGFTVLTSDIPKGSIIERPKLYVEGNIEAESVETNQGSIVVQGSILSTKMRSNGDIHIRDGVVRKSLLIALENTVYIQGNVESGSKIVAKKIVIEGSVVGSLLLGDNIVASNINGAQVYGKTIRMGLPQLSVSFSE